MKIINEILLYQISKKYCNRNLRIKYKNNVNINQFSDNLKDKFLLYIFKRRKTNNKDELKVYFRKLTIVIKTDILLW